MATATFQDANPRRLVSRPKHSAEVVVVGAGLSGLQAAYDLQQAGISCLVLEAQDRVGGHLRSVSHAHGRGVADFGGAFVHEITQPRTWNLVRSLGVDLFEQNAEGKSVLQGSGSYDGSVPSLSEDDKRSYLRVRDNLESLSQHVDINDPTKMMPNYGSMNVAELVASQGASPIVRSLANVWTSTIFGLAAKDVSALYFLLCCRTAGGFVNMISSAQPSGRRMRFRGGAQQLCDAVAKRLQPGSVQLSKAVQWIDQTSSNRVVLTTADGEVYQCTKVVLAAPTSIYNSIEFSPALGEHKQWMQDYEQPGFYAEAVLVYEQPWWRELGLNGHAQSLEGPVWEIRDSSCDVDGLYSLTCVIAGETGMELWQKPDGERYETLLQHVTLIYGDAVVAQPLEVLENTWEGTSRHVPCPAIPTSHLASVANDQFAAEQNIHFVGSEASHVWRGFIEGALASGSRGAEEVLEVMRPMAEQVMAPRL